MLTTKLLRYLSHDREEVVPVGGTVFVHEALYANVSRNVHPDQWALLHRIPEIFRQENFSDRNRFIFNPDSFCWIELREFFEHVVLELLRRRLRWHEEPAKCRALVIRQMLKVQ